MTEQLAQLGPAVAVAVIFALLIRDMQKQNGLTMKEFNDSTLEAHREKTIAFTKEIQRKDESLERMVTETFDKVTKSLNESSQSNKVLASAIERLTKEMK